MNEAGTNRSFSDYEIALGAFPVVCGYYDKAIDIFKALGDYANAKEKMEECILHKEELQDMWIEKERQRLMAEEQQQKEQLKQKVEDLKQSNKLYEDKKCALQVELNNLRGLFAGKRRKEILSKISDIEQEQMHLENEMKNVSRRLSTMNREGRCR